MGTLCPRFLIQAISSTKNYLGHSGCGTSLLLCNTNSIDPYEYPIALFKVLPRADSRWLRGFPSLEYYAGVDG
jgi:hypothetical protein